MSFCKFLNKIFFLRLEVLIDMLLELEKDEVLEQ